jgi:hypothetical protein
METKIPILDVSEVTQELLSACLIARSRFSGQNAQVDNKVWNDNYPAVRALDQAIENARKSGLHPAILQPLV